jgi:glycosyltransferase involved in cell wall biosynthesis
MTMSDLIQVDIITIARNSADCIVKTLDSVSEQTYPHIHHIIIDGNSEDNTVSTINCYKHQKANSVFCQDGIGIANAFNEGIERSSGNLVIFLNSGDTLFDHRVITKIVDSYTKMKWDWAFGETLAVSKKGALTRYVKQHKEWKQELFFYGNPVCHQSTIFTQRLLKNVGFYDENLSLEMDFDYNIRSSLFAHPQLLYFPISCYDVSGISSVKVFKANDAHRRIRRKYFELSIVSDFLVEGICLSKAFKRFLLIPLKTLV